MRALLLRRPGALRTSDTWRTSPTARAAAASSQKERDSWAGLSAVLEKKKARDLTKTYAFKLCEVRVGDPSLAGWRFFLLRPS